jgi:hypothetical protein
MQDITILEVAGEGGSLSVFGKQSEAGDWQFWTNRDGTAAYECLSEEDREGLGPRVTSYFQSSLHDALRSLDQYPWYRLYLTVIDPRFVDAIYMEVKTRSIAKQLAA